MNLSSRPKAVRIELSHKPIEPSRWLLVALEGDICVEATVDGIPASGCVKQQVWQAGKPRCDVHTHMGWVYLRRVGGLLFEIDRGSAVIEHRGFSDGVASLLISRSKDPVPGSLRARLHQWSRP